MRFALPGLSLALVVVACTSTDDPGPPGMSTSAADDSGSAGATGGSDESDTGTSESEGEAGSSSSEGEADSDASSGADGDGDGDASTTGEEGCEGGPELSVLFIGNSYTYFNDLPAMVAELACSAGYVLDHDAAANGGYTFGSHLSDANTQAKIMAKDWDVVVLQNQSQLPGLPPAQVEEQSLPNAVALVNLIAANSASTEVMYFQTWGRIDGDQQNCAVYPPVCTFDGHTEALAAGYELYRTNTGGSIAPVGFAWRDAVNDGGAPFDTNQLWSGDGSHPELHGSYLAASVFFAALWDQSPVGSSYPDGLTAADAQFLQTIAAGAVLNP